MHIISVDHVILPTTSLPKDAATWQRLGMQLTPPMRHASPTENQVWFVGNESTEFYVELLGIYDQNRAAEVNPALLASLERPGLYRLMLAIDDAAATIQELYDAGVAISAREVHRSDGAAICTVIELDDDRAGCAVSLLAYTSTLADRRGRHVAAGVFEHAFPVRRLDHLAIITQQLDEVESFWNTTLGVATVGEVRGQGMLIRQLQIGDAIVELIAPDGPDSHLVSVPGMLASMVACEVDDVDAAVVLARARGFDIADAQAGVLAASRVATISGSQLGGLALQLIQLTS